MQWTLSEEQSAWAEALRGWLGDVATPGSVRAWLDAGDPAPFEERLVRDQMVGVGISEDLGGQGGGVLELVLTAEELARAGVPTSAWLATALSVGALPPDLATAALAGGHAALLVPAEGLPDTFPGLEVDANGAVSGTVERVLGADRAATYVVVVKGGSGLALVAVEAGAAGVEMRHRSLLDRSRSVADVTLTRVPSVPLEVDAAAYLARATDLAAVLVAADALGASQRMLDLAVVYSLQRTQFGVAIGSFQAVKHAAASILVAVEAARSGLYFAAASVEAGGEESGLHAAAMKAQVTADAARTADTALTMHGAIGYTWEHDLQLFYKRAKLDEHLFGAPASWNERLAEGLALT
jgi:alkylation response protein AidB-like acyl-CoA dehydrogenase